MIVLNKNVPNLIKYMGSKTEVLDLIEKGFNCSNKQYNWVCDLFAGSATLSGALRGSANIISNDIQEYSGVFASVYLNNYQWDTYPSPEELCKLADLRTFDFKRTFKDISNQFDYDKEFASYKDFNLFEDNERLLINNNSFSSFDNYYLFTQYYSGTYWSFDQCVWIDSMRKIADDYVNNEVLRNLILACLMYSMAYSSQSTGHYAEYRIPATNDSMNSVLIYRKKKLNDFFIGKFKQIQDYSRNNNDYSYRVCSKTEIECLGSLEKNTLVYADPPYSFVHYSRFYHVLETLVKYDYPVIEYQGRYRSGRYQSEYCQRSKVQSAFAKMFCTIMERKCDLVLSYSDSENNTIKFEQLLDVFISSFAPKTDANYKTKIIDRAKKFLENDNQEILELVRKKSKQISNYSIKLIKMPYQHSRMGRTETKTVPVTELLFVAVNDL